MYSEEQPCPFGPGSVLLESVHAFFNQIEKLVKLETSSADWNQTRVLGEHRRGWRITSHPIDMGTRWGRGLCTTEPDPYNFSSFRSALRCGCTSCPKSEAHFTPNPMPHVDAVASAMGLSLWFRPKLVRASALATLQRRREPLRQGDKATWDVVTTPCSCLRLCCIRRTRPG